MLSSGAYAHYWRATSDQALAGPRYANYLLLARVLEHVAEHGCEYVERGESGGVRSLIEFKERFGPSLSHTKKCVSSHGSSRTPCGLVIACCKTQAI